MLKRTEIPARDTIHRALTIGETKLFLKHARESWYYDLYRFLLYSGVRCGEAGALCSGDIKVDHIEIRRTVTRSRGGLKISNKANTAAGHRDLPYTSGLRAVVDHQHRINRLFFGKSAGKEDEPDRIFKTRYGGILCSDYADKDIKKICSKAGITPFTVHAFRDTFAIRAIESGMNPKTLQELLGHSSYELTMSLYVHVMPSTKQAEMSRIRF